MSPGGSLAISYWPDAEITPPGVPTPTPALIRQLCGPLASRQAIGRLNSPSDWPPEQPPSHNAKRADTLEFPASGRREGLLFARIGGGVLGGERQ